LPGDLKSEFFWHRFIKFKLNGKADCLLGQNRVGIVSSAWSSRLPSCQHHFPSTKISFETGRSL